jgi:WD40 repeat protein/3',5'-cyclic AMP phosphodiesterase CpdA
VTDPSPETFTVRFFTPDGRTAGLGALVSETQVVTCAHVVNQALGREKHSQILPNAQLRLDFPYFPVPANERLTATISAWRPPPQPGAAGDDIAGLVIKGQLPPYAIPGTLMTDVPEPGTAVDVLGFPPARPRGTLVTAAVIGPVPPGRLQLESDPASAQRIQPGFSGGPLFHRGLGQIAGLAAEAEPDEPDGSPHVPRRDSYAIGAALLRTAWPAAFNPTRLTILHLAGPRFTGDTDIVDPDMTDLDGTDLGLAPGQRPDILVVTGDLADGGLPSEYRRALEFLARLADAAGVPRAHVVIVPGCHDVNRRLCEGYFTMQEGSQQEPAPPYFPKWAPYRAALAEFYADVPGVTFTPDEPWTLFEMPDLRVVVAGLNSTMAQSHRAGDDYGELGTRQLAWFTPRMEDYRAQGWTGLAAVHHDPATLRDAAATEELLTRSRGPVRLTLSGRCGPGPARTGPAAPAGRGRPRYEIRTVDLSGASDQALAAAPPDPDDEIRPPADPYAEFLAEVRTATRTRFPDAVVDVRPEDGYLRISRSVTGAVAEQSIVGVVRGSVTESTVDNFASGVHAQYASMNSMVRSQLVYGGEPAPDTLVTRARRQGIRLLSFIEYQGLIDLRPLARAQRERLAGDRVYPAELYVEQRFTVAAAQPGDVRTGLIGQAVAWLSADAARLIVVLGDFGRGKTSFLRQLTRILPGELPHVIPVLVELRGLEKGPSLDDLLTQHLVRQDVEDVSAAKLRYMIDSGRVALLFDGFDELELRVGYDTAADYLQSLLNSVTGQAKLVLTSRTQHFRSPEQVRNALGRRIENRAGSRVVILEDFAPDQIYAFLTKLYGGDEARARQRLDLIASIANLLELTRNPRILAFVAQLDDERLRGVRGAGGQISPARLYTEIIEYWLSSEEERQSHPRGLPWLTKDERFAVCTDLALRLWKLRGATVSLHDLSTAVGAKLARLAERGFSGEQAAHSIASGSLLVRTEDDAFAFIHQSVMEWLVAAEAARDLKENGSAGVLRQGQLSRLMAAFFVDLAGEAAATAWARAIMADPGAPESAKQNVLALLASRVAPEGALSSQRQVSASAEPMRQDLAGVDLRGQDLSGLDLRGANLRDANLSGMRLDGTDLSGADLTDADLTGVVMTRGSLAGATLTGSTWNRAAILGSSGLVDQASSPELDAAALDLRDQPDLMLRATGTCGAAAFSPDGALLAVSRGRAVELADAGTGMVVRVVRGHTGPVTAIAFSPDGTWLTTASRDGTVHTWDTATGQKLATFAEYHEPVLCPAFSPDGTRLATASLDGTRVWSTVTGVALLTLSEDGELAPARTAVFSPDGTQLATAGSDSAVRTWDTATGQKLVTFTGHAQPVLCLAFSPDGTRLITASRDGTTRTWDTATGHAESTLLITHDSPVVTAALSSDGTLLAVAGYDTAHIWNTVTGQPGATLGGRHVGITSLVFSRDGTRLATANRGGVPLIVDAATGQRRIALPGSRRWLAKVIASPGGSQVAVIGSGGIVCRWDTAAGIGLSPFQRHHTPVIAAAFSPDGIQFATISLDGTTRVWDTVTGAHRTTRTGHDQVKAAAFSPHGTVSAVVEGNGTIGVWETATAARLARLTEHGTPADVVEFSPDGTLLASAGRDGITHLWHSATGSHRAALTGHATRITAVAFSSDGTALATASADGTVRLWNLEGRLKRRLTRRQPTIPEALVLRAHPAPVNDVRFSPGGQLIATAAADGTVCIWVRADGTLLATLAGHEGPVNSLAFTDGGALLATASDDGTVRLWDLTAHETIATLVPLPEGGYATLFPDGSYKLEGDPGDTLWWAMKLCRFAPGELDPYLPEIKRLPSEAPIPGHPIAGATGRSAALGLRGDA